MPQNGNKLPFFYFNIHIIQRQRHIFYFSLFIPAYKFMF